MNDIESIRKVNWNLRKHISLVLTEMELIQRVCKIKQIFLNSERIITPILERILRIKSTHPDLQSGLSS
jgi:hypothetical protein